MKLKNNMQDPRNKIFMIIFGTLGAIVVLSMYMLVFGL